MKMTTPMRQVVKLIKVPKMPVKVKMEVQSENEDELNIPCRLCSKIFCNDVALRNHLRMEHSGEVVDMNQWVQEAMEQKQHSQGSPSGKSQDVARRTAELLNSMQPTNIMSLANQDVSYIIIKPENDVGIVQKVEYPQVRKRKLLPSTPNDAHRKSIKREREIVPITGPFECLQASTLVADGLCHQIFFSCCDYSIHFRDEHTRRRKAIKCQVCEKVLASTIGEEATSPYPCHVCGHGCASRDELTEHINTEHVKLKPYQCSVCHKRFTQQGGVQQHMRMHTGDRPFSCSFCQKSFTQKSGLDQHLRTHTKVKPYRCVICGKKFVQSVHLKQHMRTHTNVSPFQCVICEKRFKQSSHLNYHLKNHNEANMTDDQKNRYKELLGLINEHAGPISLEVVESEQSSDALMMEEQTEPQQVVIEQDCDEQVVFEQAEGSEVILQDDREYILSDNGNETWSVKVVN